MTANVRVCALDSSSAPPFLSPKVCSLWMPVDPVPRDACVQFVAGSHLWPRWFIPRKFATEHNYPLKDAREAEDSGERQYYDVPVEEIEAGKWPILQWECKVRRVDPRE